MFCPQGSEHKLLRPIHSPLSFYSFIAPPCLFLGLILWVDSHFLPFELLLLDGGKKGLGSNIMEMKNPNVMMYGLGSDSWEARPELEMFSKYSLRTSPRGGVGVGSTGGQGIKLIKNWFQKKKKKNWFQDGDKLSLAPQRKPWGNKCSLELVPPEAGRWVLGTPTSEGCCRG